MKIVARAIEEKRGVLYVTPLYEGALRDEFLLVLYRQIKLQYFGYGARREADSIIIGNDQAGYIWIDISAKDDVLVLTIHGGTPAARTDSIQKVIAEVERIVKRIERTDVSLPSYDE